MYQKIKDEIKDIIQIVNECPDSLKEKCFEILLSNLLHETSPKSVKKALEKQDTHSNDDSHDDKKTPPIVEELKDTEEEISKKELHAKTKRFMETEGVSLEQLNKMYYKDNGNILPLYDDLGTNKMAEAQIRITLLMAFENSLRNGEFEVNGELVRKRCIDLKYYDKANFSANFKNNKEIFEGGLESYDKNITLKLSSE